MFQSFPNVPIVVDPQLGPIAVGGTSAFGASHLRAYDLRAKKTLWELKEKLGDLEPRDVALRGRNVYVRSENVLVCLDLATGQKKWQRRVAQRPDDDFENGLVVGDPYPPGTHGAILVSAGDEQWLYALDRESGALLWEREFETSLALEAAENLGTCAVWSDFSRLEIYRPESATPIATVNEAVGTSTPRNGSLLAVLANDDGRKGIVAIDLASGRETFFEPVDGLDEERPPCAIEGQVFAVRTEGRGLYAGPNGQLLGSPVAGTHVVAVYAASHTLGVLVYDARGYNARRLVGLDPQTLAIRFDSGPMGYIVSKTPIASDDDEEADASDLDLDFDELAKEVATDGASFVVFAGDDPDKPELRCLDAATGRPRWVHAAEHWHSHQFRGGLLLVRTKASVDLYYPPTGQWVCGLKERD